MATYALIDEPAGGPLARLAVNPLIILLASFFLPWVAGPIWMIANGTFIKSATLWREIRIVIGGGLLLFVFAVLLEMSMLPDYMFEDRERYLPYFRILFRGAYLLVLYKVFFLQSQSYELLKYVRDNRS